MKYWIISLAIAFSLLQDGDAVFGRKKGNQGAEETYAWQYPHDNVRPLSASYEVESAFSFLWSTLSPAHPRKPRCPLLKCFKCLCGGSSSSEENSNTKKKPQNKKEKNKKKNKLKSTNSHKPWGFGKGKGNKEVDAKDEFVVVYFKR